jgi:thiol-disulfide isomerase/thioredoxin
MNFSHFHFALINVIMVFFAYNLNAQCTANQTKVKVVVKTDNYGHETFWQVKNATTSLVYKAGGNPKVYPGGLRNSSSSDPGAYGNNIIKTDSVCIDHGTIVKFSIYDGYGDGICCNYGNGYYRVFADADTVANSASFQTADSSVFSVPTPSVDLSVIEILIGNRISVGNHFIRGYLKNKGSNPITSFKLNWTIDSSAVRTEEYTNVNIGTSKKFKFSHKFGWNVDLPGTYNLKVWISDVNGNGNDEFTGNDMAEKNLTVFQNNRPVLVEAWTNASCPPCAAYMPGLEVLLDKTSNYVMSVMYHSDYPGYDIMNTHNPTQVKLRGNYYGVNSYPSWFIDGEDIGNYFVTEQRLYDHSLIPPNFDFIEPKVIISGDTIYGSVKFQARSNFTGNFRAHAVVVEREMDYSNGPTAGSNGEKTFDWVMKYMLTGTGGKNVGTAYVTGQGDSITGKWKMENVIDTNNLAIVYWIQNNTGKAVQGSAIAFVRPDADYSVPQNTSIEIAENGTTVKTFPNPAVNTFNIELTNLQKGDINIDIYSLLGHKITTLHLNENAGEEKVSINTSEYDSGIYIVRIHNKQFSISSRMIISK